MSERNWFPWVGVGGVYKTKSGNTVEIINRKETHDGAQFIMIGDNNLQYTVTGRNLGPQSENIAKCVKLPDHVNKVDPTKPITL